MNPVPEPGASAPRTPPAPLVVAASLVAVEALVLLLLGVAELWSLSADRLTLGITTAGFFLVYAAGLGYCAWGVHRLVAWTRAPIVLTQLIGLGLAWNFRGGGTTYVAVALLVVAVVVLVGVFHPASMDALSEER